MNRKKLLLLLLYSAPLWCMEETIEKVEEKNELKPHRRVKVIQNRSEKERYNVIVNSQNATAILRTQYTGQFAKHKLELYNLKNGELLKTFKTEEYTIFMRGLRIAKSNLFLLFKGDWKDSEDTAFNDLPYEYCKDDCNGKYTTKEEKPFYFYDLTKDEITNLNYTLEEWDEVNHFTAGVACEGGYKILRIWNQNRGAQKILFFDEKNNVIHTQYLAGASFHIDASPSGNALLVHAINQEPVESRFHLYNIENKKEPKYITYIQSSFCWWDQLKNIFCDFHNLYNEKGEKIETLVENERVIGFSDKHFASSDWKNKKLSLSTRDRSKKVVLATPSEIYSTMAHINNEEELVVYDVRCSSDYLDVYKSLVVGQKGYFGNCVIN